MSKLLEGKNIIVVGGTSGIGLSAANYFVDQGASIIAFGLLQERLLDTDKCKFKFGDVLAKGEMEKIVSVCHKEYGSVNGLYHVAGGSGRKWGDGPLHEITDDGWDKTLELNLKSVMLSNRAIVKYFIEHNKSGAILNTSTVLANHPSPKYFYTHAYAAAKAGIIGFSKSIAAYYAAQNIRVNVIAPSLTNTPMAKRAVENEEIQAYIKSKQPLDQGRIAKSADLDAAACYFLSDASSFTTGQVLAVDGGWSVSEGQYN